MSIVLPWTDESSFPLFYIFLKEKGIDIRGILHIGAHECQEKKEYNLFYISDENIVWIEGNSDIYNKMKNEGIQNIYNVLVDSEERDVIFNITNNGQSSSIFPLGVHKDFYPDINVVEERKQRTTTLKSFFDQEKLDPSRFNYWSLDIQGAEYNALKGAGDLLQYVDAMLVEVNFDELYRGIPLINSIDELLNENGFIRTHTKIAYQRWGDALYVKKKYVS